MSTKGIPFLDAVSGYVQQSSESSADRPIRLAVIDPSHDPFASYPDVAPLPRVIFDGESVVTTKRYPVQSGFIPAPGQRVWMVPIGTTYLICSGTQSTEVQGFYGNPAMSFYTTEFGEGNYFEVDHGVGRLVANDVDSGGFSVPRGIVAGKYYTTTRCIGLTNTEIVLNMETGSYTFLTGRSYDIEVKAKVQTSVVTDAWIFRMRETNVAGTQRGEAVWLSQSTGYGWSLGPYVFSYIPATTSTVNFVLTGQRLGGTGTMDVLGGNSNIYSTFMRIRDNGENKLVAG